MNPAIEWRKERRMGAWVYIRGSFRIRIVHSGGGRHALASVWELTRDGEFAGRFKLLKDAKAHAERTRA